MAYSALQMAEAFIQAGELTDALEALNTHLAENAADDAAREMRLMVLSRLEDTQHLTQIIEDVAGLAAPQATHFTQQAQALYALDRQDEAVTALERALALAPEDQRVAEQALNLYIKLKDWLAALKLIDLQPRTWHWLQWQGDVLVHMGDERGAITCYKESLRLLEAFTTDSPYIKAVRGRLWITLGHSQRRVGLLDEAEASYQNAQELLPDDATIVFYRGLVKALAGQIEEAAALCRDGLAQTNPELRDTLVEALSAHASYRVLLPLL